MTIFGTLEATFGQTIQYVLDSLKETSIGSEEATVFRLDKQMMYTINDKEKTYSSVTFDQLEGSMKSLGSKMDEHMAGLQKKMESLPPDQRKMMEQMMGDKMPGKQSAACFPIPTSSWYATTRNILTTFKTS